MTLWIIGGIAVALVWFVVSRIAPSGNVRLGDISALFSKTQSALKDPSYAQLAFVPPGGKSAEDAINLQFSRDAGRMGLEWSLLPPLGVRDQAKFFTLAQSRGQHPVAMEAKNGYKCLRVEDGDLIGLMDSVLRDLYAVTPETAMNMVYDGFTWP